MSFESEHVGLATLVTLVDSRDYAAGALTIARVLDHPIYDCIYLAMAEEQGRKLITADDRFLRKARASMWEDFVEKLA